MSESKEDKKGGIHGEDVRSLTSEFGPAADVVSTYKPPLTVLINESGKMVMSAYPEMKDPLKITLEAALKLSRSGTPIVAAVWGRKTVRRVEFKDADAIMLATAGLGSSAGFSSVIDYMSHETSLSQEYFHKPQHFAIISDGKKIDPKENPFFGILRILNSSPETTIDFVMIGHKADPEMRKFAQLLKTLYPNRINFRGANSQFGVNRALKEIAEQRIGKPEQKPEIKTSAPRNSKGFQPV